MLIKVVALQTRVGQKLSLEEKIYLFKQRPDFVCLPEYALIDESIPDYHRAALYRREQLDYLSHLSDELSTCLIAGTVVDAVDDRLYNACYVINRGFTIGRYFKRFPVEREQLRGISPGKQNLVLEVDGLRFGVMICGDVFYPELYSQLGQASVDMIFVPTTSLYRPDDSLSMKHRRDNDYFMAGARCSGAYVVKVCGVGRIFNRPLQGRSLIAAPWGVLERVEGGDEQQERCLVATLDVDELREFRGKYRLEENSALDLG